MFVERERKSSPTRAKFRKNSYRSFENEESSCIANIHPFSTSQLLREKKTDYWIKYELKVNDQRKKV